MAAISQSDTTGQRVAVVIAAYNAQATIARAIRSALAEGEVREVVVVDDRSRDATVQLAREADDGTGRLAVLTSDLNGGPAAARNRGIDATRSPLVALLDSDDYFLPGRFAALLPEKEWDFVADNIAIVREDAGDAALGFAVDDAPRTEPRRLTAASFVEGCLTRPDRYRGELAFLKPVMRRGFLEEHGLRYSPHLRLAEDFDFYTRALMTGARFLVSPACRYVATERANSLSAVHGVDDLERIAAVDRALIEQTDDRALKRALGRHFAQTHRKFRHRAFLANKHERGLMSALAVEAARPADLAAVLAKIASDKLGGLRHRQPGPSAPVRYLLEA